MCGDGIPLGRILEIYGDESTGKSLLGWEIAKAFQKQGGIVVVFDTEATAPRKFMERVGVNVDDIIYRKPTTIEDLEKEFLIIHQALTKIQPDLKILYLHDSVAATCSKGEWEYDKKTKMMIPKEAEMAARARAMSRLMRHIAIHLSESKSTYIAINQVRDKIGVLWGEKTTTPGGRALKFHSSIRIQLNRGSRIDVMGQHPIGVICNVFIKKNKCAEPFRKAPMRIIWKEGFDRFGGLAELLESQGRIKSMRAGRFKHKSLVFRGRDMKKATKKYRKLLGPML
jgi:recombination protein RecA